MLIGKALMDAIIYHNPECGTSCATLATIRNDLLPTPQRPG